MTWLIRPGSVPAALSTASIAATIPPVMSGVPGTLALAITRSAVSMITASVLVPPTSTPRRQSGGGTGQLLHGQVVEVVAERARPGERDPLLGPPDRIAGEGDHRDPLAVGDQLGDGGEHPAALERHQVLVLEFQPDQAALVRAEALDHHRAAGEPARRPALDVQHLPGDQPEGAQLRD